MVSLGGTFRNVDIYNCCSTVVVCALHDSGGRDHNPRGSTCGVRPNFMKGGQVPTEFFTDNFLLIQAET